MKQLLERTKLTSATLHLVITHCHPERTGVPGAPGFGVTGWGSASGCEHAVEGPCVSPSAQQPTTNDYCPPTNDFSAALGQPLSQLLKRPEITIEQLVPVLCEISPGFFDRNLSASSAASAVWLSSEVKNELKSIETEIKYAGYLGQQERAIERLKKAEQRRIPEWFDYKSVSGLSREMQEKLRKVQPQTLGQASRIPGVTPAAVSLVNVYIEIQARRREQAAAL